MKIMHLEARSFKTEFLDTGHLLLAILKESNSNVAKIFSEIGIDYYMVREELEGYNTKSQSDFPGGGGEEDDEEFESFFTFP